MIRLTKQPAVNRCETCKWFVDAHTSPEDLSVCRRHAPIIADCGIHYPAATLWPRVTKQDWCGEYCFIEGKRDE